MREFLSMLVALVIVALLVFVIERYIFGHKTFPANKQGVVGLESFAVIVLFCSYVLAEIRHHAAHTVRSGGHAAESNIDFKGLVFIFTTIIASLMIYVFFANALGPDDGPKEDHQRDAEAHAQL